MKDKQHKWIGYCDCESWDGKPRCKEQCNMCKSMPDSHADIATIAGTANRNDDNETSRALIKKLI